MKLSKSFIREYFFLCASLMIAVVVALGMCIYRGVSQHLCARQLSLMQPAAENAASAAVSADGSVNAGVLAELASGSNTVYILFDSKGDVLECSEAPPYSYSPMGIPHGILAAADEGPHFEISLISDVSSSRLFYFVIGTDNGGYLAALSPSDDYMNELTVIMLIYAVPSILLMTAAVTVIWIISSQKNKQLSRLRSFTIERSLGEGNENPDHFDSEEFSEIAAAVDNMAIKLNGTVESHKDFVANVSHELRTPMTNMSGFIDGIIDGTIPQEMHMHYLNIVREETARLSRLVKSMIITTSFDHNEVTPVMSDFDMVELASKSLESFSARMEEKNISYEVIAKYPHIVHADVDLVKQLMYNLLDNAYKFTNDGGYVKIYVTLIRGRVVTAVRNSGSGISSEELPRLFEKFYKTDKSRGIDKSGLGLGLPIVNSIVRLHGGSVTVKCNEDEYVEFSFDLAPTV